WQKCRNLAPAAALLKLRAQTAVRRDAACYADALRVISAGGVEQAVDERCHDDALEARADVGDFVLGKRALLRRDVARDRRFQSAEAEIEIAFFLGRIAIAMREARRREWSRAVATSLSETIDRGASR